jgi:predicted DNA-binding transcriptional regulator YafY
MPANLNALIRYKTINSCLYGGRRRWSIDELGQKCSDALAENSGRHTTVSERTIRDDIRVMRSDILGFNAPIKQERGLYFYTDPGYSILSLRITDAGLAEQILGLLMKMRDKVSHPEMEIILEKLCRLLDKQYEPAKEIFEKVETRKQVIFLKELQEFNANVDYSLKVPPERPRAMRSIASRPRKQIFELLWGDILVAAIGM